MKLLVTGGAGFIGSNFVRQILRENSNQISKLIVLDKLTYAGVIENLKGVSSHPKYQFIQGDICDQDLVRHLLESVDAIVNFAAESHVDRSIFGAEDFVQTNIVGVQVLLNSIKASKRKIRFLL